MLALLFTAFFCVFALANPVAHAGRVLMMPSAIYPSHKMVFNRLAKELITRGHEVVSWQVVMKYDKHYQTPGVDDRQWKVDVPERYIQNMYLYENSTIYNVIWDNSISEPSRKAADWAMMTRLCERMLDTRKAEFDKFLTEHFDVVLVDDLFTPCGLLFVGLTRIPFVYYSQTNMRTETAWSNQSPSPPSYVPVPGTGYTDIMDFGQRSFNVLSYVKNLYIHMRMILRPIDDLFRKHYPGLTEAFYIERNATMNFVNTPPLFDFPRAYMPRVIFVGALHCRNATAIKDNALAAFVDDATDGFVLFTTGHTVPWDRTPSHIVKTFVDTFAELKQRVVWQYDGPQLENLPKNVMVQKWLPQQDLLGHANCKLFLTHGGLNSIVESMWHGIPVLGLPIVGYHLDHIMRAVDRGAGDYLNKGDLDKDHLVVKIKSMFEHYNNFKSNAEIFQDMITDVPYTELDHAAFWTEFIIKHQENPQSRSGADELNVFQYFLVDVMAFMLACFFLWILLSFYCLKFTCRCCKFVCVKTCCRGRAKPKKE